MSAIVLKLFNDNIITHISITIMLLKGKTISIDTALRTINTNLSEYEYINFVEV